MLLLVVVTVDAERAFDNVLFTSEKCHNGNIQLGNYFDACAVIEFCIDPDNKNNNNNNNYRKTRRRYLDNSEELWKEGNVETVGPASSDQLENQFVQEVGQAEAETRIDDQHQHQQPPKESHSTFSSNHEHGTVATTSTSSKATYGWRLQGTTDCSYPGPIMRLKRGVKHGLIVQGSTEATNLHFHGLHIAGHGNGDDMDRSIQGSDNLLIYEINLPADQHHGGTHWYHSHLHGASWDQVQGGAFGMIVIDENGHEVGTTDINVLGFLENEKIMILDNTQGSKAWRVNGMEGGETFSFVQNEWYRMRILATNVDSHTDQEIVVFPDSCTVHAIAHDGIFRFTVPAEQQAKYTLTSSSRLDVAIKCSDDGDIIVRNRPVATIEVDSSKKPSPVTPFESGSKPWESARLEYTKDLRELEPDNRWTVRIDETNINGISTYMNKPLCDMNGNDFQYGTVQEWEIKGAVSHPFHVHMYPMQVTSSDCGEGHALGEYYDTIVADDYQGHCKVRLHLIDVAGPTTVHCHIFEHAEHGALAWLNVVGGPNQSGPTCLKESTCVDAEEERPKCSDVR